MKNRKYKVELEIAAERISDDITQLPDLYIDLACFDQLGSDWDVNTKPAYFKKYHISENKTKFSIVVDRKPKTVAIDPYGYLLDADGSDHVVDVK